MDQSVGSSSHRNRWARACGAAFLLVVTSIAVSGQTFTTLHSFDSTDGANPFAALVQGLNGGLYGTTYSGGESAQCSSACGTVFKITTGGTLTTLYNFCSQSGCTDGAGPVGNLVLAANGDFYGTTKWGGSHQSGTVFKITSSGALTTLYSFCALENCTDGANPTSGLVLSTDGDLYGTTYYEGNGQACGGGCGTVFKITASGQLTTLHTFDSTDGSGPAALIQASDGNFYGTTYAGGKSGFGSVFRITAKANLTTLHSFDVTDGSFPYSGLIQAIDGNLYGTTSQGGINDEGTAYKITTGGKLNTIFNFCACSYGSEPLSSLIQATDGNFYGTTFGSGLGGTLFQLTLSRALTTLYTFCSETGCPDGSNLYAPLLQDTNGTFYGVTHSGGANGDGTVFSLSMALGPFVETLPSSGNVGKAVKILGTGLTGVTSVTFNGTAATFKVASSAEITTTVPAGATTGKVEVTTQNGVLSSQVNFQVSP